MQLLLDTHILLWAASDRLKLSATALALIEDADHERWISIRSLQELSIKVSTNKLSLPQSPIEFFRKQQVSLALDLMPLRLEHLARVANLPFHHRDPFDRLLIAQSLTEGIPLVSSDAALDAYGVTRLWDEIRRAAAAPGQAPGGGG